MTPPKPLTALQRKRRKKIRGENEVKIFIEHRGSSRHPWLCCLAESAYEKGILEQLYRDAQSEDDCYVIDNNIEWQQQNFKLMFMLDIEEIPEERR